MCVGMCVRCVIHTVKNNICYNGLVQEFSFAEGGSTSAILAGRRQHTVKTSTCPRRTQDFLLFKIMYRNAIPFKTCILFDAHTHYF